MRFVFFLIFLLRKFAQASKIETSSMPNLAMFDSREPIDSNQIIPCTTHTNCSSRILTLDTYCCSTTNNCCNWFEFTATYKSTESLIPLKAPSILTVLAVLLLIIFFLFICYCFSILFCFCFKCGIFKRPKVVILTHVQSTDSGLFATPENNSPKYSTSSSASTSSSYAQVNNRNHNQNEYRSCHRNISPQNKNNRKKTKKNRRSPTARALSNKRSHFDAELYTDLESQQTNNESPFLIPEELNNRVQERLSRNQNNAHHERRQDNLTENSTENVTARITSLTVPSAPILELSENVNQNSEVQSEQRRVMVTSILEPVVGSSLSRSNLSIDTVLAESHGLQVTASAASMQSVVTTQFQYNDDMPPSYDDIIKRSY